MPTIPLSVLDATLIHLPASVANKRLTAYLNSLDATLIEITGEGCRGVSPVVPPYLYVASTYLLCLPLQEHPACVPTIPNSELTLATLGTISNPLFPTPPNPLSIHILPHSFSLFSTPHSLNSFLSLRFPTLCSGYQGAGGPR